MKKPPPTLNDIRELEKNLASTKQRLAVCWPQSMMWKELKAEELELSKELKSIKTIQMEF